MGTTPTYAFPYPELTDPPDGPAQIKALAEAIDTLIKSVNEAPLCRASRPTTLSIPSSSTFTAIPFTTKHEDPMAMANAAGDQFTIKKAGIWAITAAAAFTFNATGPRFMSIWNNGTTVISQSSQAITVTPWTHALNISLVVRLAVNNVISIAVGQASGIALDLSLAGFNPGVNMIWLRP